MALRTQRSFLSALLLLTLSVWSHAQAFTANVSNSRPFGKEARLGIGTVLGHAYFADTGGPARFTRVFLKPAVSSTDDETLTALAGLGGSSKKSAQLSPEGQTQQAQQKAAAARVMATLSDALIATTVAADGSFSFTNVRPGRYFVHVQAQGYIDPLSELSDDDLHSKDPAVQKKVAALVTPIDVTGSDPVRVELRLERGAAVTGRVLYDDGTPAVGWTVRAVSPSPSGDNTLGIFGVDAGDLNLAKASEAGTTDDTGRFRIAGMPTGTYVLRAQWTGSVLGHSSFNPVVTNTGSPFAGGGAMAALTGLRLTVYSGDAFLLNRAKPLDLKAGEERNGYDLQVPLQRMHAVSGVVHAQADGHPVNGGLVELTALGADGKEDTSLHLTAAVGQDGSFHFDYVPGPATYQLKASHAVDATTGTVRQIFGSIMQEQKTTHSYGPATRPVMVADSDLAGIIIDVPEQETKQ